MDNSLIGKLTRNLEQGRKSRRDCDIVKTENLCIR